MTGQENTPIHHNVHAGNRDQIESLRERIKALAEESGSEIVYYASPVHGNSVLCWRRTSAGSSRTGAIASV